MTYVNSYPLKFTSERMNARIANNFLYLSALSKMHTLNFYCMSKFEGFALSFRCVNFKNLTQEKFRTYLIVFIMYMFAYNSWVNILLVVNRMQMDLNPFLRSAVIQCISAISLNSLFYTDP